MKNIYHFPVGNGNCSVIELEDFVMVIDLNKTEEAESTYEMLKPYFRKNDVNQYILDVLCITHGDQDHCCGFQKLKEEIEAENLIIGSIWHQGYDRTFINRQKDLSTDYLKLRKEIKRRESIENPIFGEYVKQPKTGNKANELFETNDLPAELELTVISPLEGDNETSVYNHNDLSIVINFNIDGIKMLYVGDSTSKYWQGRIFPDFLNKKDNESKAQTQVLISSHHGSYTFFGNDRDTVRDAKPFPENYGAMDSISPSKMIISSQDKFPLRDRKRDRPPHYAARKWYYKWFVDNRNVNVDTERPTQFKYTADGCIRLKKSETDIGWEWAKDDKRKEKTKAELDKISELRKNVKKTLQGLAVTNSQGNIDTTRSKGVPNKDAKKGFHA